MKDSSKITINVEEFKGEFSRIEGRPIVTVSVITFNSSKYLLQTLNSVREQTYPNIILQITDDCSNDETINISREWIQVNKDRFICCRIIIPEYNTGVSANCNRAWDYCDTTYCKDIAGDDLLLPDCIENNMKYIEEHPDATIVFSKARTFSDLWGVKVDQGYKHDYSFFEKKREEQYKILIEVGNVIPASSVFLNIEKIRELEIRHDERIPLLEDYPKWIQMLRKGVCFHFLNIDTVCYRLNPNSLSIGIFSPNYYKNNVLLYLYYFLEEIRNDGEKDYFYEVIATHITRFYNVTYNAAKNRRIICIIDRVIYPVLNFIRFVKFYLRRNNG